MTTMLLPADEIAKIRALKGLAYVLAVMILLDRHYPGRGFRPDEVALIAGLDKRTVGEQLKNLSVLDRVILSGSGYVLTQGGRAMFLAAANDEDLALSRGESPALSPAFVQALEAQALKIVDVTPEMSTVDDTHSARALVVEVNTLTLLSKNDSSTTYLEAQLARELTVAQVFSKSHILFGESVLVRKDITAGRALSVFAHVYSQKDSFEKPARVAYAMMRDNKEPREDFIQEPWKHLSAEYLEALNVIRYQCNLCQCEMFPTSEELSAHQQVTHLTPAKHYVEDEEPSVIHESVYLPLANGRTPAQAWEATLAQLRMEMHRAPFETWARDTKAVRFDGRTLFIGARNSYICDWLESRLQSTVERLLVGILNQSVDVEFVVAEIGDTDE